jgi:hypothetical protein
MFIAMSSFAALSESRRLMNLGRKSGFDFSLVVANRGELRSCPWSYGRIERGLREVAWSKSHARTCPCSLLRIKPGEWHTCADPLGEEDVRRWGIGARIGT